MIVGLALAGVFVATGQTDALPLDARITLRAGGSRVAFRAEVIDYSAHGLVVRVASGERRHYALEEVLEVAPALSSAHREGDRLLDEKKWDAALDRYRAAVPLERHPQRAWVRRRILAQMVRAFRGAGDLAASGETFLRLYHGEPATLHFAAIPIEWVGRAIDERLRVRALVWFGREGDPVSRLLGASYLLNTPQRGEALERLEGELSRDPDARIGALAQAQAWRARVATARIDQIEGWQKQVQRMPGALRGGPYFVLGQAYAQRGDPQRAALALLWVPLVYDDDPHLAARAEFDAAQALERLGQRDAAQTLALEVLDRFSETEVAAMARVWLKRSKSDER